MAQKLCQYQELFLSKAGSLQTHFSKPEIPVLLLDLAERFDSCGFPIDGTAEPAEFGSLNSFHLGHRFLEVAQSKGRSTFVQTPAGSHSYAELASVASSISQYLIRHKKQRDKSDASSGERVILLVPNSPEYIAAFYGILLADCVVIPLAPKVESETLERIIETTSATHIITTSSVVAARSDFKSFDPEQQSSLTIDYQSALTSKRVVSKESLHDGAELAAIFFTGGSSGTPKGVMLSHGNFISNAESIGHYLELNEHENPLCILPFMHAFGNSVLQSHMLAGAQLTLAGNALFPETIVNALNAYKCTSLSGVPDLFRLLLSRTSLGKTSVPSLRTMAVAGGALPQQLSLELAAKISPAKFFVMYGQTEATARLAYVPAEQLLERPDGAIGQAVPGVTLEIVDEAGCPVPQGEIGQLRAQGPNVMLGYWNDLEGTQKSIRDGWLYTGDLAAVDENGWLVIRGRSSSFVKISGFRVHPGELEDFAVRKLGATQAVAVSFESSRGTRLALFVRHEQVTPNDIGVLTATCRAELPHYLAPEVLQLVNEFPLNHAMKIDRPKLSQMAVEAASQRRASA